MFIRFFSVLLNLYVVLIAFSIPGICVTIDSHVVGQRGPFQKRATCVPLASGISNVDDVPALKAAFSQCGNGGTILIPLNTTYHINSQLQFNGCNNCEFQIEGTLQVSDNLSYWNNRVAILYMRTIAGMRIFSGTGKGLIDGNGQAAWERFSVDNTYGRPVLLEIYGCTNVSVTNLQLINAPQAFISITGNSKNIDHHRIEISAVSNSTTMPKNTDGFDVGSSTYVTMTDISVLNQDDCVAFKPGANYVSIDGIKCNGSHGLSVGSLANTPTSNDTVTNVYVKNGLMINSGKAAGIKFYPGGPLHGTATVVNVTWENIECQGCDYAAQIQGCYFPPNATYCQEYPSTAIIKDVYFKNFTGITTGKYGNVVANLDCPDNTICDVHFSDFQVTSPKEGLPIELCANLPEDPGINCTAGASG